LVSRGGGSLFFRGSVAFFREDATACSIDGPQPGGERAEILRMVHQMADEIRALKARAEAGHAQSPSAKEPRPSKASSASRCGEDRNRRRDRRTCRQGRPPATRIDDEARQGERTVRSPGPPGAVPRAAATKAPRVDAFDPSQNPGAPGAPRPLGSLAPAAKGPVQVSEEGPANALSLRPRPRREAMPISGGPHGLVNAGASA